MKLTRAHYFTLLLLSIFIGEREIGSVYAQSSSVEIEEETTRLLKVYHAFAPLESYSRRHGGGGLDTQGLSNPTQTLDAQSISCGDILTFFVALELSQEADFVSAAESYRGRYELSFDSESETRGVSIRPLGSPQLNPEIEVHETHHGGHRVQGRDRPDTAYQGDRSEHVISLPESQATRLHIEVSGLDRGEVIVVRHDAEVICTPRSQPRGDFRVRVTRASLHYAERDTSETTVEQTLVVPREELPHLISLYDLQDLQGAGEPLAWLALIEADEEGRCPNFSEFPERRPAPLTIPERDEEQQSAVGGSMSSMRVRWQVCHLIRNTGTEPLYHVKLRGGLSLEGQVAEEIPLRAPDQTLMPGQSAIYSVPVTLITDPPALLLFEAMLSGSAREGVEGSTEEKNLFMSDHLRVNSPLEDDQDSDGLSDIDELRWGTDLFNPDTDQDQLPDGVEINLGTNPLDADSDDDGLLDGYEARASNRDQLLTPRYTRLDDLSAYRVDPDLDGLINPLDPDSDNDSLPDGLERGVDIPHADTNLSRGFFIPDLDPSTLSDHTSAYSDSGICPDFEEDPNRNGRLDEGEGDLMDESDDLDSDHDTLCDVLERQLKSNPEDRDSDDDGILDQDEPLPRIDSDGDGWINMIDSDSDNDGLPDGLEMGITEPSPDTDVTQGQFIADQDPRTVTDPLNPDSDGGGVSDGAEDLNRDGRVDYYETNPLNPLDDGADSDLDGIPNAVDLCPQIPDPDQLDQDGDGQGDLCDDDDNGDLIYDGLTPLRPQSCAAQSSSRSFPLILLFIGLLLGNILIRRITRRAQRGLIALIIIFGIGAGTLTRNGEALPLIESRGFNADPLRLDVLADSFIGGLSPFLPTLRWGAGLHYQWSHDLITLHLSDEYLTPLIEHRVSANLQGWYRPHRRIMVSAEIPVLIDQSRPEGRSDVIPEGLGRLNTLGIGDLRLNARLAAYQSQRWAHTFDLGLTLPTAMHSDYLGEATPTYRLSYLAGHLARFSRVYHLRTHLALGHLFQPTHRLIGKERHGSSSLHVSTQFRLYAPPQIIPEEGRGLWLGVGLLYRTDALYTQSTQDTTQHGLVTQLQSSYDWRSWGVKAYGGRGLIYDLIAPDWQAGFALYYRETPSKKLKRVIQENVETALDPEKVEDQDQDQDQIPDHLDQCPELSGVVKHRGCPARDFDGDLVENSRDACPLTKGSQSHRGCPSQEIIIPPKLREPLSFELNQSRLSSIASYQLDLLIRFLNRHPELKIHLSSHADLDGNDQYNTILSQKRLEAVKNYLIRNKMKPDRISSFAHGDQYSLTRVDDYLLRAQSRRVTITFIQIKRVGAPQ